jgi:hypothetical protein
MGSLPSYTPCPFLGVRGQAAKCKAEGISHCLVGRLVQSCMSSAALDAQADRTAGCNAHTGNDGLPPVALQHGKGQVQLGQKKIT